MNEPVPPDMDGCRLNQWLDPAWVSQHPEHNDDQTASSKEEADLTGEEQAAIESHLRALGYIE
jgi:hypothetical protein